MYNYTQTKPWKQSKGQAEAKNHTYTCLLRTLIPHLADEKNVSEEAKRYFWESGWGVGRLWQNDDRESQTIERKKNHPKRDWYFSFSVKIEKFFVLEPMS